MVQEKEDLESEVLSSTTSASTESEMTSLKRMKRDMDTKIEELEDELDEANVKYVLALTRNYSLLIHCILLNKCSAVRLISKSFKCIFLTKSVGYCK